MNFVKKTIVLKQCASGFSLNGVSCAGIICAEKSDGKTKLTFTPVNLAPLKSGRYDLFLKGEQNCYANVSVEDVFSKSVFTLNNDFLFDKELTATLVFKSETAKAVLFGSNGGGKINRKEILRLYDEQTDNQKNYPFTIEKTNDFYIEKNAPTCKEESGKHTEEYADETVATENYYDNDDVDLDNLTIKNDSKECDYGGKQICGDFQNVGLDKDGKGEEEKETTEYSPCQDEDFTNFLFDKKTVGTFGYYNKIKHQLAEIFSNYPPYDRLSSVIAGSKWAKINFSADEYYLVGVIFKNSLPLYICYGVPGNFDNKPSALNGFCSFIPDGVFGDQTKGYWMTYQDVDNGECVVLQPR